MFRGVFMRRNSSLKTKLAQFSYDHKKLDSQLVRVRKSADELNKLLENMTTKQENDEKNKKI